MHPFVHSCIYSAYIPSACHCIPGTEADSLTRPVPWSLYQWDGQAACPDNHGGEVIGASRGRVTCYGTQGREGCFGLGVEAKDSWIRCALLLGLEGREN